MFSMTVTDIVRALLDEITGLIQTADKKMSDKKIGTNPNLASQSVT
jgi:hypothetical protein